MNAMEARGIVDEMNEKIFALNDAMKLLNDAGKRAETIVIQTVYYEYREKLAELEIRMESVQL